MQYLFGFSGRIGRAEMWPFLAITLVWLIVSGVLLVLGVNWHECIEDCSSEAFRRADVGPQTGWLLLCLVVSAVYLLSLMAVCVKRLHDRNKSGWWLFLYLAAPCALAIFGYEWSAAMVVAALLFLVGCIELLLSPGTDGLNDYDPS